MKPITSGVAIPARLAAKLKTPPVRHHQVLRCDIGYQRPAQAGHALREERHRQDGDHLGIAVHVVGRDYGRGTEQAGDDWQLACDVSRTGALEQFVRYPAPEHDTDRGGDEWHHGEEADLDPAHLALGRQVSGKPGQEEPSACRDK